MIEFHDNFSASISIHQPQYCQSKDTNLLHPQRLCHRRRVLRPCAAEAGQDVLGGVEALRLSQASDGTGHRFVGHVQEPSGDLWIEIFFVFVQLRGVCDGQTSSRDLLVPR